MALPKWRRDSGLRLRGGNCRPTCTGSRRGGSLDGLVAVIVVSPRASATDAAGAAAALRETAPGSSSASGPCPGEGKGRGNRHGKYNQDRDKLWSFQVVSFRRDPM